MKWVQDIVESSEAVLWLYGPAGAGKSAIAQTISEICARLGLLVASFFFSRASQSRNNEKRLIASIAYQLAVSIPATRSYVESAVQIDPAIFDKSLDTQIDMLVLRPLEQACAIVNPADVKQWPRLIVIDGLDECHGSLIQRSIIHVLSTSLLRIPVPFILLIASRPESHIRNAFNILNTSRHIVLDGSYQPDADIKEFLRSRFNEIKENHQLAAYIPESWPSEEIVNRLVRKSSGQFIFASTVIKYLDSPKHRPMKRLDVIIGLRSVDGDMPYKELDALYSHIFSCVQDFSTTRKMLGFLLFGYPIGFTPDILASLLGLDEQDIHLCLSELHSILSIPPHKTSGLEIRPTHASLQDFLLDKLRSGKYYLDEEAFHTDLAQQCVRRVSTLSMNQALQGLSSRELYLISSLGHHCTQASTHSADLRNELIQVCDLRPSFEIRPPVYWDLPSLFTWLYKVRFILINVYRFETNP